ncbi:hypothetical protein DAEQUDRAFT_49420 [Daedalea quercina L-15889]|uniref:Uncharacterized protein n=1 Tax=Daedalea quercina L-15889 TaxID=1314783 RepID=A0A165LAY8_9APHY|nr:hypothetical protein DAEQUDRAFT_49420 [Daedalea quercina L-15889]
MAIIQRATSSAAASASAAATSASSGGSPHLAMSTVTGLILGVMCLFLLVVSYQLIPCFHRRKTAPTPKYRTRVLVVSPPEPDRPVVRAIRGAFTKLLSLLKRLSPRKPPGLDESQKPNTPRSFKLAPQDKPDRQHIREKFATQLRLNLHIPPAADVLSPRSPHTLTPRTPKDRKRYAVLDDTAYSDWDKANLAQMEKPPSALLSPWSPREQDFPYACSPTPSRRVVFDYGPNTPPPPFSPPPAYVAGTPIRGGFLSPIIRNVLPLSPSGPGSRRPSLQTEDPFADNRPSSMLSVDPFAAKSPLSPTGPSFTSEEPGDDPFVDRQPAAFVEDDSEAPPINLSEVVVVQETPTAAEPPRPAASNVSSNVFVISDETDSARSSYSSTWSALTLEQPM